MTGATRKTSGSLVDYQVTYTYDALNRRIGEQIDADGAGSGTPVQTWTLFDGQNPYADFTGSGTLKDRYLYGPAVDALLARTNASGVTDWYLADRLGSVRDIVDVSGNVVYHTGYDSFGNNVSTSGSGSDRFGFTGREHDAALNLYYNRARFYDPATGRFLSKDPSGFSAGDANLYRYVNNSPTNGTDLSGLIDGIPYPSQIQVPGSGFPYSMYDRKPTPPSQTPPGYIDLNIGSGFGGGIQTGPSNWGEEYYWGIHPYFGIQSLNIGASIAPGQTVTPGLNFGGSVSPSMGVTPGMSGQVGIAINPIKLNTEPFLEIGPSLSPPGLPFGGGIWLVSGDANPLNYIIYFKKYLARSSGKVGRSNTYPTSGAYTSVSPINPGYAGGQQP
jgi:RHS repeat-associated protein